MTQQELTDPQPTAKEEQQQQGFSIGQIVYILSGNGQAVLPAMVVEESVIQTLHSKNTSWKLAVGKSGDAAKPQKIIDSKKINGEIYKSLEEISDILQKRLSSFIDKLVLSAREREQVWYGPLLLTNKKQPVQKPNKVAISPAPAAPVAGPQDDQLDPELFLSELDSVETSSSQQGGPLASVRNVSTKAELRERLKEISSSEEDINMTILPTPAEALEVNQQPQQSRSQTITGPDGTKYTVKL